MSTYINSVIQRKAPMTRCQCAVLAVMNEQWSSVDQIWKREPVYCCNQFERVKRVGYGTIAQILKGLVQQGFIEQRPMGKREKQYRRKRI